MPTERTPPANARKAKIHAAGKPVAAKGSNRIMQLVAVVLVAIVAAVALVVMTRHKPATGGSAVPVGAAGMGEGWVANAGVQLLGTAPTVSVYEDFRCPICAVVEASYGPTIEAAAKAGKIRLVYHFKTVIDINLGGTSSQRAANDALCVAAQGGYSAFARYHDLLFRNQPAKEGDSFPTAELTGWAATAGLTGTKLTAATTCMVTGGYLSYVQSTEDSSAQAGVTGTPHIFVNGTPLNISAYVTSARQADLTAFERTITTGTVSSAQTDTSLPTIKD